MTWDHNIIISMFELILIETKVFSDLSFDFVSKNASSLSFNSNANSRAIQLIGNSKDNKIPELLHIALVEELQKFPSLQNASALRKFH